MFHLKTSFAHHFRIHGSALSLALKQMLVATRIMAYYAGNIFFLSLPLRTDKSAKSDLVF